MCSQGGRRIPEASMKQESFSKINEEYAARGTLKVVVLEGSVEMTPIICNPLHGIKSFYMMSMVTNKVKEKDECILYYSLNTADKYNSKMGRVDVGDQLRNY